MTKKHFIALADAIRNSAKQIDKRPLPSFPGDVVWTREHLAILAQFCHRMNPQFNEQRWAAYVRGECGPNGGKR